MSERKRHKSCGFDPGKPSAALEIINKSLEEDHQAVMHFDDHKRIHIYIIGPIADTRYNLFEHEDELGLFYTCALPLVEYILYEEVMVRKAKDVKTDEFHWKYNQWILVDQNDWFFKKMNF